MANAVVHDVTVDGYAAHGFEAVRDAFAENLRSRHELGGACSVYRHGAVRD